jgi:transposase
VFNKIFAELARRGGKPERIMIDATHLKAHRTAASLLKKGLFPDVSAHERRPELQAARGLRRARPPARHALKRGADERLQGRGADAARLPKARELLADKGYDADWLRAALAKRGVAPCIPSKSNRKVAIPYDAILYKQRHKIENMFGRLKDWQRIHTRYDRCAHTYFSPICIAAALAFWL